jgi:hypothetical protein
VPRPRPQRQRLRHRAGRKGTVSTVCRSPGDAKDAADIAVPGSPGTLLRRTRRLAVSALRHNGSCRGRRGRARTGSATRRISPSTERAGEGGKCDTTDLAEGGEGRRGRGVRHDGSRRGRRVPGRAERATRRISHGERLGGSQSVSKDSSGGIRPRSDPCGKLFTCLTIPFFISAAPKLSRRPTGQPVNLT